MPKAVLIITACLLFSGCSDSTVQKYLDVEQQKINLDREKFEFEKSRPLDKYFISMGQVPYILNKETGQIYKFGMEQTNNGTAMEIQPIYYDYGKDENGQQLQFDSPEQAEYYFNKILPLTTQTKSTSSNKGK